MHKWCIGQDRFSVSLDLINGGKGLIHFCDNPGTYIRIKIINDLIHLIHLEQWLPLGVFAPEDQLTGNRLVIFIILIVLQQNSLLGKPHG